MKLTYCLPKLQIFPYWLVLLFLLSGSQLAAAEDRAVAENSKDITFITPAALQKANITDANQAASLATSVGFIEQLTRLAKALSAQQVDEQNMFNKVALLSMRASNKEEHQALLNLIGQNINPLNNYHYSIYSQIKMLVGDASLIDKTLFNQHLTHHLTAQFSAVSDEELFKQQAALGWSVPRAADYLLNLYQQTQELEHLNIAQAINLIVNTQLYLVIADVIPVATDLLTEENNKRYEIQPDVLVTTEEGIQHSLTIVRKRNVVQALPTAMQFTIYANESEHIKTAIHAAAHGYIGVVANSRGKRSSTNDIVPWEHEGKDATAVIDWITKQQWSDGRVVMYGGSYNGFTQWAATKYMHPALKTIVPYAAASPITGLPVMNNIVITANYEWPFYVTNNKTIDNDVYSNWQQSNQLKQTLFESGRAISDIDKIAGTPNPWFQKWLEHSSYDHFYQDMLPYEHDYAQINIPVLTITGYFDGGQISALDFMQRHYQYNKNADHTLLIGPYDHYTAQGIPRSHHSNYQLDEVALVKDTEEVAFQWFDYVLYGKAKPALLKGKVNYQLMGSNTWQHHASFAQFKKQYQTYYLHSQSDNNGRFLLATKPENIINSIQQKVDLTDRTTVHNANHWTVIEEKLNEPNGLIFITEPMGTAQQLAGLLSGEFSIAINKKDVDIGYNFYEMLPDGKVFHLSRYISRASYAHDMSKRKLLVPHQKTRIPITNNYMTAKLIDKGSRLVLVLNVNKNTDAQVNMGSGKNVNIETIADAGEPLTIKWFNDSKINIPLTPWDGITAK